MAVTNILCQTKRLFAFSKIGFCAGTSVFEEALNAVKFLGWLQKFGQAQNILGPVKGQGINAIQFLVWLKIFGPIQTILGPVEVLMPGPSTGPKNFWAGP